MDVDRNAFTRALMRPEAPAPKGTNGPKGEPAEDRFDVYRNNVIVSLLEALSAGFPVVEKLLGSEFFTAMAREYCRDTPPKSPIMTFYGAGFDDWLKHFPPVAHLPYLPEIAQIEQARRVAAHAADAPPLDTRWLAQLPADELAAAPIAVHPAARAICTRYRALAIWARNSGAEAMSDAPSGELLISRPQWQLQMRPAPRGTAQTLQAIGAGVPLARALPGKIDQPAVLACLFSAGALRLKDTA